MTFKILGTPRVQPEYSDDWETAMILSLVREDGVEGDVWIMAGVPDSLRGTAEACGHRTGLESVRCFDGGSWDCWCSFARPADDDAAGELAAEIIEAVKAVAMAAYREARA